MDPITIALGIAAVGKLLGGLSSYFGSHNQAKALKIRAEQDRAEAGVAASQALAQGERATAAAATQAAANGGGLVGSSLAVVSDLARQSMFNARAAVYRGQTQVRNDLYEAKVVRHEGTTALIGSLFGAAGAGAQAKASQNAADARLAPVPPDNIAGIY